MTYRVIQWATGNVGKQAVEGVLAHPELELVGAYVYSDDKAGRDAGEICGLDEIGVAATADSDEVLALDAECVVYAPMLGNTAEVLKILRAGKNIVTPVGWFYPGESPEVAEIEAACREAGVSLHGTGIHPGGITERFPLMVSGMARNVRHVRAEEFSDIRNYAAELVVREVMLFGKPVDEAGKSPMLDILGAGFGQSVRMVADGLGVDLDDDLTTDHEMAVATTDIDTPVGVIEEGTVAAQRFTWTGTVDGRPFVTARVNWLMGDDHLDPAWELGEQRFEVELDAEPPVALTFHGLHPPVLGEDLDRLPGIIAPAMHCVNAVPYVVDAEPGIRTYLDLPLVAGRGAPFSS